MIVIFFQAEDGIRDRTVTGVQTCALPIWRPFEVRENESTAGANVPHNMAVSGRPVPIMCGEPCNPLARRSEERRVGKECGSRRSADFWSIYGSSANRPGNRVTCADWSYGR